MGLQRYSLISVIEEKSRRKVSRSRYSTCHVSSGERTKYCCGYGSGQVPKGHGRLGQTTTNSRTIPLMLFTTSGHIWAESVITSVPSRFPEDRRQARKATSELQSPPFTSKWSNKMCSREGKILPSPIRFGFGNTVGRETVLNDSARRFGNCVCVFCGSGIIECVEGDDLFRWSVGDKIEGCFLQCTFVGDVI